jgi:hypothetical protein
MPRQAGCLHTATDPLSRSPIGDRDGDSSRYGTSSGRGHPYGGRRPTGVPVGVRPSEWDCRPPPWRTSGCPCGAAEMQDRVRRLPGGGQMYTGVRLRHRRRSRGRSFRTKVTVRRPPHR